MPRSPFYCLTDLSRSHEWRYARTWHSLGCLGRFLAVQPCRRLVAPSLAELWRLLDFPHLAIYQFDALSLFRDASSDQIHFRGHGQVRYLHFDCWQL